MSETKTAPEMNEYGEVINPISNVITSALNDVEVEVEEEVEGEGEGEAAPLKSAPAPITKDNGTDVKAPK